MRNYFADNIRYLREKAGMTQEDLGKIVGVSRNAIGNWEAGIREPKNVICVKLADYFGVSFDSLICEDLLTKEPEIVLNEVEKELISSFRALTDEQKTAAVVLIRSMVK